MFVNACKRTVEKHKEITETFRIKNISFATFILHHRKIEPFEKVIEYTIYCDQL